MQKHMTLSDIKSRRHALKIINNLIDDNNVLTYELMTKLDKEIEEIEFHRTIINSLFDYMKSKEAP